MTAQPAASSVIAAAALAHWKGDHEVALALYRQAAETAPPLIHYNIAVQLRALGRHQEALPHLVTVLRHHPGMFMAWTNAGDSLREIGNTAGALEMFKHALAIAPQTPNARYNAATAHHNLSRELLGTTDFAAAKRHAEAAVALMPNDAEFVMALAECQLVAGELENGWENYEIRFLRSAMSDRGDLFQAVLGSWRGTTSEIGELDMGRYSA